MLYSQQLQKEASFLELPTIIMGSFMDALFESSQPSEMKLLVM